MSDYEFNNMKNYEFNNMKKTFMDSDTVTLRRLYDIMKQDENIIINRSLHHSVNVHRLMSLEVPLLLKFH